MDPKISVTPLKASILHGQTQQFTANKPVRWTAKGGTITDAGLYTAGGQAGVFEVKAIAANDPRDAENAEVTVRAS
jgi:chitinase